MAQLQWRDVNAPDFSGSAEGFRTFSNLLDSAFGGLKQSVNQFDAIQTNRVNQELMRTAMGITDAAAFDEALPGMLQDPRAARLTAENLAFLGGRTNALLQTEGNRLRNVDTAQDMNFEQETRGRTQDQWKAEDAVQPYASEALRLAASGDDAGARAVWARPEAQAALGQMAPDKAAAIISGEFRIGSDRRGLRDSDLRYDTNLFEFNETKTSAAERTQAESVVAALLPRATTLEEAEGLIYGSQAYKDLPAGAQLAADTMIRARFPNAAPAIAGAAGAPVGGGGAPISAADALNIVNYEARGRGFTTVPAGIQTYDQLQNYGRQMVQGTNGEGSSATGPFQITYTTRDEFAPRVLGANWRTLPRTVESEDKIAEAIFNDSNGSAEALRGRWVSLSPSEAERVRRLPWSQARQIIANGESNVDLSTLNASANAAQAQIADQRAQSPVEDLLAGYAAANRQNLAPAAAAATLTADGGALAGANRADAIEAVNSVAARYGVTNSVAAALISNNVQRPGLIDFRRRMGGIVLDHDGIKNDAALLENGGLQRGTVALQTREGVSAGIETARAAATTAAAELAAAIRRQAVRPDLDISAYVQRDRQARQAFQMAQAASQAPGVGYQPPVAPQAPVRAAPAARPAPARTPANTLARRPGENAEDHRARVNQIIAETPVAPVRRAAPRPAPAAPTRGVNDYARRPGESVAAHRIRVRAMMGL
jgi:hypothetical protein